MTHPYPSAESDMQLIEASARALASNVLFPASASQSLTAALRMFRRQSEAIAALTAQVKNLRDNQASSK